jgi:hypothetical protein
MMGHTFSVSDVARETEPKAELNRAEAIEKLLGGGRRNAPHTHSDNAGAPVRRVEAMSTSDARLVAATDTNAFAQAAHDAFYEHHPLRITPDAIWFCIAQGFARHVEANAESLRKRFVKHEGKQTLVVDRPDFVLGRPNPWPEVFAEFSDRIAEHVGKLRDLVVADFSTTGPIERAASEVVVMDTFQAYFEYVVMCGCGIPSITLEGTVDDWKSIRRRASMLSEFGLEKWIDALLPVLDEIVRTAEGQPNRDFWRSFFRYQSGSGPSEMTGWIMTLFPYIERWSNRQKSVAWNPYLEEWEKSLRVAEGRRGFAREPEGPAIGSILPAIASAPVRLIDARDGSHHPVRFVAGMFGVVQDATGTLAPEFGWAVVHEPAPRGTITP